MHHLNHLLRKDLVIGIPKLKFEKNKVCEACQKGKQVKNYFQSENVVSTSKPLELLHIELFVPSRTMSLGGDYYGLVIVNDYSRFTWTLLSKFKNEAFDAFRKLAKVIQNEKGLNIVSLRSDQRGEFQNESFEKFCEENGIHHNFSDPSTPQQNSVVERENTSLEEEARTLLNETKLPKYFWANVVHTICYTLNKVLIRSILKKTPYELYKGRKPNIYHLRVFGCKCFVLNNCKDSLGTFDAKAYETIFLGYSLKSKGYRVFNRRTLSVEEYVHVVCDETNSIAQDSSLEDEDAGF